MRGPAGIAFQTETAAWKCSYRIAKIDGEYQLVVAAVIDNTSGMDWIDVELVLIVDQPLGFHAPISTVHRAQRTNMLIPSPFSAAPPALAAGSKRNLGELLADGPMDKTEAQSSSGLLVSTGVGSTGWLSSVYNMTCGVAHFLGVNIPMPKPIGTILAKQMKGTVVLIR